jgi:DNA repair protein SbcC/Rad50
MILKSLTLTNIRSYLDARIEFPKGSTLLAGDIGSGKSTILLAIEFALFGIKSGELPGSSLLRNGKREGSVELRLDIDGKDILIKRVLKQGANGISQDAGYIIINGMKKDATPKELRAIVFELLGYPKDLVSKNKDLVYRYTVYTPQEAMREILYAKTEERLDTLRKVFNVDKYKRIRENTIVVLGSLKEKRKELEGFTSDLTQKQTELDGLSKESLELKKKIAAILPKVESARKHVAEKKESIESLEKERTLVVSLQRELAALEAKLHSSLEQRKRNIADIERAEKEVVQLRSELEGKEVLDFEKEILTKRSELQNKEKELRAISQQVHTLTAKKAQSEEIKLKIRQIDNCPLCLQEVSHDHKGSIASAEEKKQHEWNILLVSEREKEHNLHKEIEQLKMGIDILMKKQGETAALKLKHVHLERQERLKAEKTTEQDILKKSIGDINIKKLDINLQLENKKGIEELYAKARNDLDLAQKEERLFELEHASLGKEMEGLARLEKTLAKDVSEKKLGIEKLTKIKQASSWLSEFFMNLMTTMEKHVMLQINREFNELFKNWFSTLMEDETLSVRLNDEFTPIIEQNGYETQIENLSGGEKTSVALAYRLALNKVINDVVSDIRTKDILMLDEPTDGFSNEQLDKVREVLDMLQISQVIIVSHESKIESFVDKVIRISKHEHISRVVSQ